MPKIKYGELEVTITSRSDLLTDRVIEAFRYIVDAPSFDGEHHKVWFLDQTLRALLGSDEYYQFVRKYNELYGEWDKGVAP